MTGRDAPGAADVTGGLPAWADGLWPGDTAGVILDTDIGPDADDAGALAMLHGLMDRGEAELLAAVCDTTCAWGAPCLSAINTYYGRPEIPVGTLSGPGPTGDSEQWSGLTFNRYIAENWPHAFADGRAPRDGVSLYRETLARAAPRGVTIVSIGGLTVLRDLFRSGPDAHSPLGGLELVARTVRLLAVMGGHYPAGRGECNFGYDVPATRAVVAACPVPLLFCGYEVGQPVYTGPRLTTGTDTDNPVRVAYERWDRTFAPRFYENFDPRRGIYPHSSHDQVTALVAVRGPGEWWDLHASGHNRILDHGANEWQPDGGNTRQAFIVRTGPDQRIAEEIERLMVLPRPSHAKPRP